MCIAVFNKVSKRPYLKHIHDKRCIHGYTPASNYSSNNSSQNVESISTEQYAIHTKASVQIVLHMDGVGAMVTPMVKNVYP